jgi:hypothetical protein
MKNFAKTKLLPAVLLAALLLAGGCSVDDPTDVSDTVNPPTPADASNAYVAMGNSLTAGFMDGGLMMAGQQGSYPQLIAAKMGLDFDHFSQPFIESPGVGSSSVPDGYVAGVLYYNGVQPTPLEVYEETEVPAKLLAATVPTQYHNLGVPGARLSEIRSTYNSDTSFGAPFDQANPFFDIVLRSDRLFGNTSVPADPSTGFPAFETASMFWQAIAKGPALVTFWIGANDVLGAAMGGDPIGDPTVTDPNAFAAEYQTVLGSLAGALLQSKGVPSTIVVGTVPMVTNSAYFLSVADFAMIASSFGSPGFDEADVEYVLLLDFLAYAAANPGQDLPADVTLSTAEVTYLSQVIGGYNMAITQIAAGVNQAGLATVGIMDTNAVLGALEEDQRKHFLYLRMIYGGPNGDLETVAETAARTYFSLDGVHPNNVGYAYVANAFMEAINATDDSYAFTPYPLAAFSWDPTYADYQTETKQAAEGLPRVDPEVLAGLKDLFR